MELENIKGVISVIDDNGNVLCSEGGAIQNMLYIISKQLKDINRRLSDIEDSVDLIDTN